MPAFLAVTRSSRVTGANVNAMYASTSYKSLFSALIIFLISTSSCSAKGRTTESGAALARGRDRHGGGRRGFVAHVWLVATTSLSLPRTCASGCAAIGGRELGYDHAQNAGKPRARSACSRNRAWRHDKRGRQAGRGGFPGGEAQAWLSSDRYVVPSIWSSHSIGCSLPSSNRLTTFWFLVGSGWWAAQR